MPSGQRRQSGTSQLTSSVGGEGPEGGEGLEGPEGGEGPVGPEGGGGPGSAQPPQDRQGRQETSSLAVFLHDEGGQFLLLAGHCLSMAWVLGGAEPVRGQTKYWKRLRMRHWGPW